MYQNNKEGLSPPFQKRKHKQPFHLASVFTMFLKNQQALSLKK